MDKDQFSGILALKLVAEKKSFTAAAEELQISGPAVSKMIAQLEKKMNVPLLIRTTRTVNLTEAGQRFLDQAGPAMDQIILAQQNAQNLAEVPSGTLRLNMPSILYPFYLAPLIETFVQKYPDVCLDICSEDQTSDVFENNFDAGIRLSEILAKDMVAIKLFGPINWVIAASPEYLRKYGKPKHPKDLLSHNCIRARMGLSAKIYDKWEFQERGKEFEVKVNGNLTFNDTMLIRKAAMDGLGVMFTSYEVIKDLVESGNLEIVLSSFQAKSDGFYLYFPNKSQVSSKLRAFINHFRETTLN